MTASAEPDPCSRTSKPAQELDLDVDTVIAACGGDSRAAVRALLVANSYLTAEVDRLKASWHATVSRGYARGRIEPAQRKPDSEARED